MPRFSWPVGGGLLAEDEQSSSTKENTQDNYLLAGLEALNTDKQRLEGLIGVTPDAETAVAGLTYTSTNAIANNKSLKENLERLDAAVTLSGDVVNTSPNALAGTISMVNGSLTFTVDTGTDVVTCSGSHSLTTGQAIRLESTTTLPGGLSAAVTYYAGNLTATTFKLYLTSAAAIAGTTGAVDITSSGTGTHSLNGTFISGASTLFTAVLVAGDYIYIDGATSKTHRVSTVESDTALLLYAETSQTLQAQTVRRLDTLEYPLVFEELPLLLADGSEDTHPVRVSQISSLLGTYLAKAIVGKVPYYNDAASLILPSGLGCFDSTGTMWMQTSGAQTVSLASSGANGLDTGSEAVSTKYYVYLIGDSTGVNATKGLLSVTNENASGSVTLPSGYDKKRQLPLAIVNDASSNQIPWYVHGAWASCHPTISYNVEHRGYGNTATASLTEFLASGSSGTFAAASAAAFIPAISRVGYFVLESQGSVNSAALRATGESHKGIEIAGSNVGNPPPVKCRTNASQSIDYKKLYAGGASVWLSVDSYEVTEM